MALHTMIQSSQGDCGPCGCSSITSSSPYILEPVPVRYYGRMDRRSNLKGNALSFHYSVHAYGKSLLRTLSRGRRGWVLRLAYSDETVDRYVSMRLKEGTA